MPREINDSQPYQDKLVKLIPTEIVGAYMVLAGMLGFNPTAATSVPTDRLYIILIQVVFFVLVVLTPLYLWRVSKVTNIIQLIVTTLSFVVWVYTLGGPFAVWKIFYPIVGSVLLILWSLITPLVVPPDTPKVPAPTPPAGG